MGLVVRLRALVQQLNLVQELLLDFFNVPVHETFTSPAARVLVDAVEKGSAHLLRLRYLVGCHARSEIIFDVPGLLVPLRGGKVVPGISEHVIFRYAPALLVQDAEAQLGLGVPLFG